MGELRRFFRRRLRSACDCAGKAAEDEGDVEKFDVEGFNVDEFDVDEFDVDEFDVDEFDVDEFDVDEFDVDEFDVDEFDVDEFDVDGDVVDFRGGVPDEAAGVGLTVALGDPGVFIKPGVVIIVQVDTGLAVCAEGAEELLDVGTTTGV